MKQVIFDKESPKGRIVEIEDVQSESETPVSDAERIEALEATVKSLTEELTAAKVLLGVE